MKKTLLTLAAVGITAGAWAQVTELTDVTPNYYKFYEDTEVDLESILRSDVKQPVAFNLGSTNWITTNTDGGENYFTPEQISNGNILFGAFVFNQNKEEAFAKGFSLYNFGGTLGTVLVRNGVNSKLNEAVQSALDLESAPSIPYFDGAYGANWQYNHIFDFISMNDYFSLVNPDLDPDDTAQEGEEEVVNPIRIRVKMVMNAYYNDMSTDLSAIGFMHFQNEAGDFFGAEDIAAGWYVDYAWFATNGVWDPTKWLVREFEFDYKGIAGALKLAGALNDTKPDDGAFLLRSIEVYVVPEEEAYPNLEGKNFSKFYDSWEEYTVGGEVSGVNSISKEENTPVEYYNLQGVKVANPENGIYIKKQGNTTSKVVIR